MWKKFKIESESVWKKFEIESESVWTKCEIESENVWSKVAEDKYALSLIFTNLSQGILK